MSISNQTIYDYDNSTFVNQTLDQFLDSIGDVWYLDLVYMCLFPIISFFGIIFNAANVWIFFHKDFAQPNFFYFRITSIFYLIHSFWIAAYGICASPRYMPYSNTYIITLVQLIYIPLGK